jgi:hypothetical protein
MALQFRRETIWRDTPSERTLCVVGDVSGNGVPDIVLAARNPRQEVYWLGRNADGVWERHYIDQDCEKLDAGGFLADLNGNGRLDFIAGGDGSCNGIFWWENPADPTQPWRRTTIYRMPSNQCHDQFVADLDGDGRQEVYFWNQHAETLFYAPIPDDPYQSPWPTVRAIASGMREEGLTAADVDGDGRLELIAGQSWYRPPQTPGGDWERYPYIDGYISTRVLAADFTGDGQVEIIVAEGDATIYKPRLGMGKYARLARCRPGADVTAPWQVEVLHDQLLDPHSLVAGDFNGNGRLDLFVGELGDPNGHDDHPPAQRVYLNRNGQFEETIIEAGLGTHESKAIVLDGKTAIICKSYRNVRDSIPRTPDIDSIHLWIPEDAG